MSALGFFVVVANFCGAGMIVPQVARLRRTGDVAGVSYGWTGVGLGLNGWWTVYAVVQQLWGLLPVSVVALLLYGAMARQLVAIDRRQPVSVGAGVVASVGIGMLVATVPPALALAAGGWPILALALGLAYAVQFLPALVAVTRAASSSGVSSSAWVMALVEASVWFFYGLEVEDAALIIGGSGGALAAAAILWLLHAGRRREQSPGMPSVEAAA